MFLAAAVALIALLVAFFLRLPRELLRGYVASFRRRHGVGVQISLTVLATVLFAALVATATQPGHALAELASAAAAALLSVAAVADVLLFSRRG